MSEQGEALDIHDTEHAATPGPADPPEGEADDHARGDLPEEIPDAEEA